MISRTLLKSLLKKDVYAVIGPDITDEMLPSEFIQVYAALIEAHTKYTGDISTSELYELYVSSRPTLTDSKKQQVKLTCDSLEREGDISVEIAKDLLVTAKRNSVCDTIIHKCLDFQQGRTSDVESLRVQLDTLQHLEDTLGDSSQEEELSFDINNVESYLQEDTDQERWALNLAPLNTATRGGVWRSSFGIIAARPDAGKSAIALYFACGPGGFLEQGANVHIWRNEEAGIHILRRAINTAMSWPIWSNSAFIQSRIQEVKDKFASLPGKLYVLRDEATDYKSVVDLERYCKKHADTIDVLIIDQLDKMTLNGSLAADRTDLREIYTRARAIGKRHGIAVIAVTQAGSGADGKLYFGYNDLDESKTGKAAEGDYIFCIGASFAGQPEKDDGFRVCNLAKNKLGGPHAPVPFMLTLETSSLKE